MSVEHLTTVLHHSTATGAAKLVLLGIANHQGDGGAWPSIATLCKYAGLSGTPDAQARTMRRILRRLEDAGELHVTTNGGGLGGKSWERPNLYRVLVECPTSCDGSTKHRTRRPVDNAKRTPGLQDPPRAGEPGDPRAVEPGPPRAVEPAETPGEPPAETPGSGPVSASTTDRAGARRRSYDTDVSTERHTGQHAEACGPCAFYRARRAKG